MSDRFSAFAEFLKQELRPYPGRWRGTLMLVAAAVLALCFCMALGQSNVAFALLFTYFCIQDDLAASVRTLVSLPLICFLSFGFSILVLNLFGLDPAVRFVAGAVAGFIGLYFFQAAVVGMPWLIFGILGESFLRSWDNGHPGESTVEGGGMTILAIASGCLAGTVISVLFAPRDQKTSFERELAKPFELTANILEKWPYNGGRPEDRKEIASRSLKGSAPLQAMLRVAERTNPGLKQRHAELAGICGISALLLDELVGLEAARPRHQNESTRLAAQIVAEACRQIAGAIHKETLPAALDDRTKEAMMHGPFPALSRIIAQVHDVLTGSIKLPHTAEDHEKKSFLRPDAFTNPAYLINAAKTTAAILLCYAIIAGTDYSGISTSIATCFLTALSTIGQARQKQSLRIVGNILGGIFALASVIWVIPRLSSIAGLAVLIAVGTVISGWITLSSPRLSYVGVQFSMCFYLSVLGSNNTPTTLTPARDRVIGVLLGTCAMWLIYDQIKPVWTVNAARAPLADALESIAHLSSVRSTLEAPSEKALQILKARQHFSQSLGDLRTMIDVQGFEVNLTSDYQRGKLPQLHRLADQLQQLYSLQLCAAEYELASIEKTDVDPGIDESLLQLASIVRDPTQQVHPATWDSGSIEGNLFHEIELNVADLAR